MKVKVLFFGVLAEITGTGIKIYEDVKSTEHLKQRVLDEFPEIFHYKYNIALNNSFINTEMILSDGDEISFIPPFEGG
jgi:molybdopterin converting factor small subunit